MKAITLYAVPTFGGQIIDGGAIREIEVIPSEKDLQDLQRLGFIWDSSYNYYKILKQAQNAINWALSN